MANTTLLYTDLRITAYHYSVQVRLVSMRELQSATGEELDALMPSVLDKCNFYRIIYE